MSKKWNKRMEKIISDPKTSAEKVYKLTKDIDEHPEEWGGDCFCRLCQSYL